MQKPLHFYDGGFLFSTLPRDRKKLPCIATRMLARELGEMKFTASFTAFRTPTSPKKSNTTSPTLLLLGSTILEMIQRGTKL